MMQYQVIEKGTKEGTDKLNKLYGFVKNGYYLVTFQLLNPQSDEETYRATYFAKLQVLANETGHTKPEMHEIIKEHLISPLFEKNSVSRGSLELEEWVALLKAIEIWAFQTYEVILP